MSHALLIVIVEAVALTAMIAILFSPSPVFNWFARRGHVDERTSPTTLYRLWVAIVCLATAAKLLFDLWSLYRGGN